MATKTEKVAAIAQTPGTALGSIYNGGSDYRTVDGSMDVGDLIFDNSIFQNKSKACIVTNTYLSFKLWGENQNGFNADCDCDVTFDYNLFTVSSKNGTDYSGTRGNYLFSQKYTYGENGKNENFKSHSYTYTSQYNNLFFNSNLYPSFHLSMSEDNFWTKALVWIKELYITFTYLERYYANFYVDGALYSQQAVETGASVSITSPTKQYYKFTGWRSSEDGKLYTTPPVRNTATDVNYTAEWEWVYYNITWNYNGGTLPTTLTNPTTYRADSTSWNDGGKRIPSKPGYVFTGWQFSPSSPITQDGYKGYTSDNGGFTTTQYEGYTKYKLNCAGYTANTWKRIHFGNYSVSTSDTVTITGQIRVISAPVNFSLYHGQYGNDYSNSKKGFNSSNANNQWQRFSISRTGYTDNVSTGCFEVYTSNLNGQSGYIEFDLREIKIIKNGDTSTNLCETKGGQLTQNLTATAMYRPAVYVTYDTIFSYLKWKEYQTITGSGSTVSNITNTGFTLKANRNDAYTNESHRFPFPIANVGSQYTIEYEKTGATNTEAFVFFHKDANTNWDSHNSGGGTTTPKFNFTVTSGDTYGSLRTDVNVNGETANFSNFRIYPINYSYMSTSLPAAHRSDCETWSMTNPNVRTGYTFKEWNTKPDGTGTKYTSSSIFPTSDLVLYSIWTINKYKATFLDYQGNTIETTEWNYNTTPSCSKTPTRPSDAQYHYTFAGWQNIGPITQDTTYVPIWESTIRKYNVIWYNDDGTTVLETDSVKYGDIPVYDKALPEKSDTAEWDYTFIGWKIGISNDIINPEDPFPVVVGEITYTAQYSVTKQKYTVTWLNHNGEQLGPKQEYEYGDVPVFDWMENGMPTKEEDDEYYYEFLDWDTTPGDSNASGTGPITSDIIYTAVFTAHRKKCKIILQSSPENGGTVTGAGEYQSGALVSISATPNPGYVFIQWNDGNKDTTRLIKIAGNITYAAEFKKILCYWNTTPITEAYLNTTQITI